LKKIEILNDKNYLVKKSENLLLARYKLSEHALKIMNCLISMVHKDDEDFQEYVFTAKSFKDLINSKSNNVMHDMIKVSKELLSKPIQIKLNETETLITNMIISGKYEKNGNYIKYEIHPKLKPFLLNLKTRFLSYDNTNVLSLKSNYSIRLYELLKHHYNQNSPHTKNPFIVLKVDLNDFIEYFQIPKSYNISKIQERILDYSKKQFKEKTDIFFEYELNKKYGRKYDEIVFKIAKN